MQTRCLNFARLGYVTFSSAQDHYEDLYLGVSHQTLMIWNNMRALDYLQSLPQVDQERIGVSGASGGGLQTQMIAALDSRVKAATIVGLTCDFRRMMFPQRHHCTCNHFPGIMRFTDHPEISALALPTPIQFLTMNDWTRQFEEENYPTIRALYAAAGVPERVDCRYFDTPHNYDQRKREWTYWWMEKWLRGRQAAQPEPEPATEVFPVETIKQLTVSVPEDRGFRQLSKIYQQRYGYRAPALSDAAAWRRYRRHMTETLRELLGESAVLPRRQTEPTPLTVTTAAGAAAPGDDLAIERVAYPSEANLLVPTIVLRRKANSGKLPVLLVLGSAGKESLLASMGNDSPTALARAGSLVALPDVRCYGELFATDSKDQKRQGRAWERNGIVWGRPVPGMCVTDLRAVLDGLAQRPDVDMSQVKLVARGSGGLALAALFAAALDDRVTTVDVDFVNSCFAKHDLPLVPWVLRHGDVLQWAALLADRSLTLRNLAVETGDHQWLAGVFATMSNRGGLQLPGCSE